MRNQSLMQGRLYQRLGHPRDRGHRVVRLSDHGRSVSEEFTVRRCVLVHFGANPSRQFLPLVLALRPRVVRSPPSGLASCLAMSSAKFQSTSRVDRAAFVAKTRKAQGIAKTVMQNLFSEAGPHKKTVVDWGSLKWTDLGFEIRFKEEKSYMNAYAWFARTLGKELAEGGASKNDFELNLFSAPVPDTQTASVNNAAGSSGLAPAASVSDDTNTPQAPVAVATLSTQSLLPPWASSSPALKLVRADKPGPRDKEHYPILRRLGSGTFGEVFQSTREGFDVAVKSFKSKEHGWSFALEDASSACLPSEPAPGRGSYARSKRSLARPPALLTAHPLVTPLVRPLRLSVPFSFSPSGSLGRRGRLWAGSFGMEQT